VIDTINYFPVKGLNAHHLAHTTLRTDRPIANDRRFALTRGGATGTSDPTRWRNKGHFLQLARHPKLAKLTSHFDSEQEVLTIYRQARAVSRGQITDPLGRTLIEGFFTAYLGETLSGPPKLIDGGEISFSDQRTPLISLINAASVRDLERIVDTPLAADRFRGNLVIEGAPPWAELEWLGQTLAINGARLTVVDRIARCAAINVDPSDGRHDGNLLRDLERGFGHRFCGVLLRVVRGGPITRADAVGLT
ncbi:MAG: MOSC domain-containing protein, partial [Thalassobaculaceae bacterium]